jgi:hypothetical protein
MLNRHEIRDRINVLMHNLSTQINKKNSIAILINSVLMGQKMGAYLLKETKVLKQAIDYFNPNVTDKTNI